MTAFSKWMRIVFFGFGLILAGCNEQLVMPEALKEAERVMVSAPDSALSLLEYYCEPVIHSIHELESPFARAKYALLYSQALEEMRIQVSNDSMIRIALDYYTRSQVYEKLCRKAFKDPDFQAEERAAGDFYSELVLDKAKAFFYYGRILEHRGEVKESISAYLDAAGILEKLNASHKPSAVAMVPEHYLKGRIYSVLGRMLYEQHSLKDALLYYKTAEEAYQNLGDTLRLLQITEGKAMVQYLMSNYPGALRDYNQALLYAARLQDTAKIISLSRGMAALVFHFTGDSRLTKDILIKTSEKYNYILEYRDYPLLALVYLREGRVDRSRFFFDKSLEREKSYTPSQKVGMYSVGAKIEAILRNYAKAYEYSSRLASLADSLNKSERENLVVGLIQEYNHKKLDVEKGAQEQRHQYLSIIYMLVIIISGLLIAGAVFVILAHRRKIRRKDSEIVAYLQQLSALEVSRTGLMEELDSHVEKEALLKDLLQTRFAEIRELARTYYEYGYSKNLQRKVEEMLSVQLLQGESFEIIEKVVNARKNDAIGKIRQEYPGLKEEYVKLLCLIYAGFSPQEMCAVLSDTPQNIYVKKYRLKNKLAEFIKNNPEADF